MYKKSLLIFFCVLLLVCALFPRALILKFAEWKISTFCKKQLSAQFSYQDVVFEKKGVLIKNAKIQSDGPLNIFIDQAYLQKNKKLNIDGVKIVIEKGAQTSFESILSALELDCEIKKGKILIYDLCEKNPLF